MDDFEHKVSSLLSSPDAMAQIMTMARSLGLGGGSDAPSSSPAQDPPPQSTTTPSAPPALEFDPKLMGMLAGVMGEYSRGDDDKTALLYALRPFLKAERAAKIDRAMQIARLSRVVKAVFRSLKGGEEDL